MAKSDRGFASMSPKRRREIARSGGLATGGKNLTREMRAKGGRNSHKTKGSGIADGSKQSQNVTKMRKKSPPQ